MKPSKTVEKINKKILVVSKQLEVDLVNDFPSFTCLTHTVKFDHFPASLFFSCTFSMSSDNDNQDFQKIKQQEATYQKKLHNFLFKQGILLKAPTQNLQFCLKS